MNPFEHIEYIRDEFKNASDRACVIVSASIIDEILEELLKSHLLDDSKSDKEIFSGFGPLSSFSAKIKLSYRLGLISNDEYKKIEIFRSIRNIFAHEIQNCTLDSEKIRNKVNNLIVNKELLPALFIPVPKYDGQEVPLPEIEPMDIMSHRDIFEKFIFYILNNLLGRTFQASNKKSDSPNEFMKSFEPLEIFVKIVKEGHEKIKELNAQLKEMGKDSSIVDTKKNELLIKVVNYTIDRTKKALEKQ